MTPRLTLGYSDTDLLLLWTTERGTEVLALDADAVQALAAALARTCQDLADHRKLIDEVNGAFGGE